MCEAMRSVPRLVLFVLCCVQCGLACSKDGPEYCDFQNYNSTTGQRTPTWCSNWTSDGGWELSPQPLDPGYSAGLAQDKDYGLLRSREACPVTSYCLPFVYYFNVTQGGDIDLSVYTNTSNGDRVKLWSLSSSGLNGWRTASVPISSDVTFNVEFEAVRRPNSSGTYVYIDLLGYFNPYPCIFSPPNATVVTTTAASSPITAITTTTTTPTTPTAVTAPTTESVPAPSSSSTMTTPSSSSTMTTPGSSPTPAVNNNTDRDTENTANLGIIFGSVIAALVIIIVVLVIILYRRDKLPEVQTCFNRKQSSRAKRGVGSGDHGNAVYVNDVTDDNDNDDTRMAVEASDYVDVDYVDVNYTATAAAAAAHTTLETPPADDVYSDVDPTCSENTYTGLGARSPPNVYLSIGQTPDHSMEADTADDDNYLHPM